MPNLNRDQLLSALMWRYATKSFDPNRKLTSDVWSALEETLVLSPSSFGLQPYRFLVIDDRATREKLLAQAWGQRQVVDASHFVVFAARTSVTAEEIDAFIELTAKTRSIPKEALNAYRDMMRGSLLNEGFKASAPHWAARQAYIALGNLMTAAAVLGVDACPMEGFDPAKFDELLGLKAQGLAAVVCCAVGYRSVDDKYAGLAKVRLPRTMLVQHV